MANDLNGGPQVHTTGKVTLIDPNPLNGNIVPIEDLSILVELETIKRGRSIINISSDQNQQSSLNDNGGNFKVNFIEGSELGKGKSLTTNYTEINTKFNQSNKDLEGLGINSIDIDFNTSYAPVVKINFTDIRGSSILEQGGGGKFSVFFELPYPIFKLTVKGYYGKAVTYCLHLTKWSGRFNSDTGNFEIVGDFIGYTYAYLTDMLMGYLKGIVNTKDGSVKFKNKKSKVDGRELLTISELIEKTGEINAVIEHLKINNDSIRELKSAEESKVKIIELTGIIKDFMSQNTDNPIYNDENVIIINNDKSLVPNVVNQILSTPTDGSLILAKTAEEIKTTLFGYDKVFEKRISDKVVEINKSLVEGFKLKEDIFKIITSSDDKYADVPGYKPYGNNGNLNINNINNNGLTSLQKELSPGTKEFLLEKLTSKNIAPDKLVIFADFRDLFKEIDRVNLIINDEIKSLTLQVNDELSKNIDEAFGFSPTISAIFESLVAHAEVFKECLVETSTKAENEHTKDVLQAIIQNPSNRFDIKASVDGKKPKIYPFPEYNETVDGSFTEKWIGKVAPEIPEVKFINNLIEGMITAKQREDLILNNINVANSDWYPVNVFDTSLFSETNPYVSISKVGSSGTHFDIVRLFALRAIALLGVSQNIYDKDGFFSDSEIRVMARIEANNIWSSVPIPIGSTAPIKSGLANLGSTPELIKNEIIKLITTDNSAFRLPDGKSKILSPGDNDLLEYNYINDNGRTVLPINGTETILYGTNFGKVLYNGSDLKSATELKALNDTEVFIYGDDKGINKRIEFISLTDYNNIKQFPTYDVGIEKLATSNPMITDTTNFGDIKNINIFKGVFKTPEFKNIDLSTKNSNGHNLLFNKMLFYKQNNFVLGSGNVILQPSGLRMGFSRAYSNKIDSKNFPLTTEYDISNNTFPKEIPVKFLNGTNESLSTYRYKANEGSNITLMDYRYTNPDMTDVSIDGIDYYVKYANSHYKVPLFGSEFYYHQKSEEAKALLFLSAIAFKGNNGTVDTIGAASENDVVYLREWDDIYKLFNKKNGFINSPKSWILYIGGILWRAKQKVDPIIWYGSKDNLTVIKQTGKYSLLFDDTDGTNGKTKPIPTTSLLTKKRIAELYKGVEESLPLLLINSDIFTNGNIDTDIPIDKNIINLPIDVKETFINEFIKWVSTEDGWNNISSKLEIFPKDYNIDKIKSIYDNFKGTKQYIDDNFNKDVIGNYNIITTIPDDGSGSLTSSGNSTRNFYVDLKDDSSTATNNVEINKIIFDFLNSELIIANPSPKIWDTTKINTTGFDKRENKAIPNRINIKKSQFDTYVLEFATEISKLYNTKNDYTEKNKTKEEIFDSLDDDNIKLNLYRNIKAIYDKWIGGSNNEDTCGIDKGETLFDTFKFLDKGFRDIGNKFIINPANLVDYLTTNYNQSLYDLISRVLTDNNFDFIPLPSFINFKDQEEVKTLFTPYSYKLTPKRVGPSFLCVYSGSRANKLPGINYYKDNSADINLKDGSVIYPSFFDDSDSQDTIPVFAVNYGSSNQSIFKNLKLDQQEFSETDESLTIIDTLASRGNQANRLHTGQNLFNVYSVRSYSCEIEALGNAMIQPMMYYQLNGIPMFHGAYLIKRVSHNITPNHMTTTFTGSKISITDVPLLDNSTIYMNLIGSLSDVNITDVKLGSVSNSQNQAEILRSREISSETRENLKFGDPINGTVKISSPIGRNSGKERHKGIDLPLSVGTQLISIGDGELTYYLNNSFGLHAIVNHGIKSDGKKWRSLYAHLSNIEGFNLTKLTDTEKSNLKNPSIGLKPKYPTIKSKDKIGLSGGQPTKEIKEGINSIDGIGFAGNTTGPHLHLEIRDEEKTEKGFNPNNYVAFDKNSIWRDPQMLIASGNLNNNLGFTDSQKALDF